MQHAKSVGAAIVLLFICQIGFAQQLRLGNNPYTVEKSAVLELQSTNQGLLFPRIADTFLINALLPPDGMVIFFTPTKQLLLRVNGSWQSLTKGSAISSLNGLTAAAQTFTTGTTGTDFNIVSAGTVHTFNLPSASATARGVITTTAQTIAGSKTFTSAPLFSSLTQGSVPFIGTGGLLTENNTNLFWDAANNRLGIGTNTPGSDFTLSQQAGASTTRGFRFTGNAITGPNGGSGFSIALGYNVPNNKQLWLGDADYLGVAASTFIRYSSSSGVTILDAIAGDNSVRRPTAIGVGADGNSAVILGSDASSVAPSSFVWANGNMSIGNGYRSNAAPANGLLVQGNVGIGTTSPATKLHVTGTNPLTLTGVQPGTSTSADSLLTITNGLVRKLPISTFATPITTGNLTETGSSILTITGGTGAVIGSGTSIQVKQANASQNGFLSSADWTTFNNKLSTVDTINIASFSVKVRSLFGAGTGLGYNASTGVFTNTGVISVNGNTGAVTIDTTFISNFATKTRSLFSAGTGIGYNASTGIISNTGVTSVNGNTGALTMDTTYISNFATKTRSLFSAGSGITYNASTGVISASASTNNWLLLGNAGTTPASNFIGTTDAQAFVIRTSNTERMRVDALGRVGIGVNDPANPLVVKDTLEIRRTGTMSNLLFSNTSGTGNFRIGGDGQDIFWQGGGGKALQMGSYWGMIFAGDRQLSSFPAFVNGSGNTNVTILSQRDASIPLGIQANSATQTGNLTEWRNSSGTALSIVDKSGRFGIGTTSINNTLEVGGTVAGTGVSGLRLTGLGAATTTAANSKVLSVNSNGDVIVTNYPTAATSWSLTGNSGTAPATNFLGTTDNQPLIIKTNNTQMGRFDANSLALGVGATVNNSTHSFAFGNNALTAFSLTGALALGTSAAVNGSNSFAIGTSAVANSPTSFALGNAATIAFGVADAMALGTNATTNASNGIAIGSNTNTAAKTTVNGINGIAIGTGATANATNSIAMGNTAVVGFVVSPSIGIGSAATINGANSVGIGTSAAIGSVSNATVIGANASVTGNNSSAIGYNTTVTQSDAIILGDMNNSNLSVGIGSEAFTSGAREKLLVDAGSVSGSYNVISGKGTVNNYLQLNIQNKSGGNTASSDLVATADNGTESANYVDLGINSSGFNNTTYPIIGGINNAYLYSTGNDFVIGNGTLNKNLLLFTGGYAATNERMRIDGNGNIGIANIAPTEKLDVTGNVRFSGALMPNNNAGTAGFLLQSNGTGTAPSWINASSLLTSAAWALDGNSVASIKKLGTITNFDLPFITNNIERARITTGGFFGLGTNSPAGRLHLANDNSEFGNDYIFDDYGSGTSQGFFMRKARGTLAAPTNVGNGDALGMLRFSGRTNGTFNYTAGSGMDAYYKGSGTNDLTDLRIFTSNTERMRFDENGNVGIGSSSFDGANPEKLLIDAGNTLSVNALYAKGSINSYFQINIQNQGTGSQSSSDLVATANNGTETTNFIDVGINGSNYVYQSGNPIETGKANDGYLLSAGNDFYLVNNNSAKDMIFLTGGTATTNEAMRITAGRRLGIGTTAPSTSLHIKTGTANDGGLRMENLTSASTVTTGAAVLGVDATGKVVRAKTPLYYSGTGTTATTEDVTKIWIAEVANNASGTTTITIPANVGFATILNIQVSAKSSNALATAPVVSIVSNTLSSVVVRAMESRTTVIAGEGLEAHTDTNTRLYVRVEGN